MKQWLSAFMINGCLIATAICGAQDNTSVQSPEKFKGHVKMVTSTLYARAGKGYKKKNGLPWLSCWQTLYDEEIKPISEIGYSEKSQQLYFDTIPYNKYGKPIAHYYHSGKTMTSKKVFSYNDKGWKTEERQYYNSDKRQSKTRFKYDDRGNCIQWAYIDTNENIYGYKTLFYDSNNNVIAVKDSSKHWISKTSYTYNAQGQKVASHGYFPKDGHIVSNSYTYDDNGSMTGFNTTATDSNGKVFNHDKNIHTYKYDKMGNWIEWRIKNKRMIVWLVNRKIEYY